MENKVFLSFGEQIFQTLKERVLNNDYAPGTMLQIEKLAEEMGVSSTPIRETLFKLHSIGLVRMVRNKGAIVSGIDEKTARNIWQFRALLELCAAREAMPHIDREDICVLRRAIERHLEDPSDFELYQDIDQELHSLFCENAENDLVKEALRNLLGQSRRVRYFAESMPMVDNILLEITLEHSSIIEAMLNADIEAVVGRLRLHLANGEKRTLRALSSQGVNV